MGAVQDGKRRGGWDGSTRLIVEGVYMGGGGSRWKEKGEGWQDCTRLINRRRVDLGEVRD